ncbi:MAG: glycoside hydrolase family 127 protein [Clostridiales bacterium]|nr:glycoside hydrolase family 127 protein [Clostridiales bacterium]
MNGTIKIVKNIHATAENRSKNNNKPLLQNKLFKLPPGSIKPKGWLKHQLDLMLDGVTGRLYEYGKFFNDNSNGWFYDVNSGWEEVPLWLRGFYPLAVLTKNKRCLNIAQRYIDHAINSQDEDGYFGPSNLKNMVGKNGQIITDIWPHMMILSPIISYYEYTEDERVIPFLKRFFEFCRNLPEEQFIPASTEGFGGWGGKEFGSFSPFIQFSRAGDMIPHLIWFYNQTNEKWVLELITRFYSHIRPPWDEWLDHHAVNFAQRFAYDAIYYQLSKNKDHLVKSEYWYSQQMNTWGQMPRGIFAADERIRPGCTDPRQAYETCGMVEFANNFYHLANITGETKYADRSEDILLNHFPATYSPDFKAVHYVTAANMPKISKYKHHPFRNGKESSDRSYVAYTPHNRCCGHTFGIGWTFYANNLFKSTSDNGLAFFMYSACEVKAEVGKENDAVSIKARTDYPFNGKIDIKIECTKAVKFPFYLRIPKWSKKCILTINGERVLKSAQNEKWIVIDREWNNSDKVSVEFLMELSYTKWPVNQSVTVDRGPLSYSLKIDEEWIATKDIGIKLYEGTEERPNYEVFPKSSWNYGICLDKYNKLQDTNVLVKDKVDLNPWTVDSAPIEIKLKGSKIKNWTLQDDTASELQTSPIKSDEPMETITMIPLGCAHLRMSCLPVISNGKYANTWQETPSHIDFDNRSMNKYDEMVFEDKVSDKYDI